MKCPQYVLVKWDGWNNTVSFIKSNKELMVWLKDGSINENDILFELKAKYRVVRWKNGSFILEDVSEGEAEK